MAQGYNWPAKEQGSEESERADRVRWQTGLPGLKEYLQRPWDRGGAWVKDTGLCEKPAEADVMIAPPASRHGHE